MKQNSTLEKNSTGVINSGNREDRETIGKILQALAQKTLRPEKAIKRKKKNRRNQRVLQHCLKKQHRMTKILYNNQIISFISINQWTESKIIIDIVF